MASSCQHSIYLYAGDSSSMCESCGDTVLISYEPSDREGTCNQFQMSVEDSVDLSEQLPPDLMGNEYLPEALHELLRLTPSGWDPVSPFLMTLMTRLPQRWLQALAGCGLALTLASRHSELFSIDGQCRLSAKTPDDASSQEEEPLPEPHQLEQEVLEEVAEFHREEPSVHGVEEKLSELELELAEARNQLENAEAKLNAVMWANRAERGKVNRLEESHRESISRQDHLTANLQQTTAAIVELSYEKQQHALQQLLEEAAGVIAKLQTIKESAKCSSPLLDASLIQWEEFQSALEECGRRIAVLKASELKETKSRRLEPFHSRITAFDLTPRPPPPNFGAIRDEVKKKDRLSSVKSLSRSASGQLSDSMASLSRYPNMTPSPKSASPVATDPCTELHQRLNEMIPEIERADFDRMLADMRITTITPSNKDRILQEMTERWFHC